MLIHSGLAHFEGIPRKTGIELSLMTRYAIFLIFVSSRSDTAPPEAHSRSRTRS